MVEQKSIIQLRLNQIEKALRSKISEKRKSSLSRELNEIRNTHKLEVQVPHLRIVRELRPSLSN